MSDAILSQLAPPADHRLPYGQGRLQFADLRLPAGPGPHPGLIVIHGGFWRSRYDLLHIGHLCTELTAAGIATWNIEYRRVGDPGGGWPGTFHDVVSASHAFFAVAPAYRVDRARISVIGHSAGGHLALWVASQSDSVGGNPLPALQYRLDAAISLAGVLDLHAASALGLSDHAVSRFLGGSPAGVPDRYTATSPLSLFPAACPRLLIHGAADEIVPATFSKRYLTAATRAGDHTVSVSILPDTDHFDLIDATSHAWPAVAAAITDTVHAPHTPTDSSPERP